MQKFAYFSLPNSIATFENYFMDSNNTHIFNSLNVTHALYEQFEANLEQEMSQQIIEEAMDKVYRRGDAVMTGFITLHFLLAWGFAAFHQTWVTTLVVSSLALTTFLLAVRFKPRTFFTRALSGIILQAFVLLYIFQLKGLSEVRLFFFTSFVILILYQDWKAMLPSVSVFFGQMIMFAYMGHYVDSLPFFTKDYQEFITRLIPRVAGSSIIDAQALGFYIGISCLQVSLAGLWAYLLRLTTIRGTRHKQILLQKQTEIEKANIDLEANIKTKTSDLMQSLENAQATEEELRQNMEELQATQDEIETQRQRLVESQIDMTRVDGELRERQQLMEHSQWLESNLSDFDELMRQYYDKSLADFSEIIILKLAQLLSATQGAFYVYEEAQAHLYMTAGYACTPQTVKKSVFKVGEGLVGQLVKTKKMMHINNLPVDSVLVESALTKVRSKTLVLMPMLYNEDIQGVIEVAVLHDINDLHLEFLQRLARNVATMLQSIRGILRTQKLLEQSQKIATQLQENARELENTKQEVERKAGEFRNQFEAIDHAMVVLEYTIDGDVLSVNENFEEISGYAQSELVGKHHSTFLSEKYLKSEEYRQLWHKIRNNDFVESEYECRSKQGANFWLHTNYYALGEGRGKKIRVLAHDTTKEKEQERKIFEQIKTLHENEDLMHQQFETLHNLQEENEQKTTQLQEQLNALNLSTALVEYDTHGRVQFANERFYEIMGYQEPELIGKSHKELVEVRFSESISYKKFWDRLYDKEFIDGEFEFTSKAQGIIWLRGNYYPVTDKRGRLLKIMQLSTDITHEMVQDEKLKSHLLDLEITRSQLTEKNRDLEARIGVFAQALAIIELSADGKILAANAPFLAYQKCTEADLVGKHYKHLLSPAIAESEDYRNMWERLNRNETVEATHEKNRMAYYPLTDSSNRVNKILGVVIKV